MKPVAVILSGCGVYDGSEITEAAGLLIALSQQGFAVRCFAPDRPQAQVINHLAGEVSGDTRHCLHESARIARGAVTPLASLDCDEVAAVVFPGGFGAAKNLLPFVFEGLAAQLPDDVARVVRACLAARKPLVALCAAPLVLGAAARDAGISGARLTFGHLAEGADLAQAIEHWGQQHVECAVDEPCIDDQYRLISVPAYMYGSASPAEVFSACCAAVSALGRMLSDKESA